MEGLLNNERELLARMIQAEAGNQGETGMRAVASVIDNRRRAQGYGGNTFKDVLLAPGQFSPANSITGYAGGEQGVDLNRLQPSETAYSVADTVMRGEYEDPTSGALNFLNPDISQPSWMSSMQNTVKIGDHLFGTVGSGEGVTGRPGGTNMARQPQPVSGTPTMSTQGRAAPQAEEEKVPFFQRPGVGNALDSLAIALQGMTIDPNQGLMQLSANRIQGRRKQAQTKAQQNRTLEALKNMGAPPQIIQMAEAGYGREAMSQMAQMGRGGDATADRRNYEFLVSQGLDPQDAMNRVFGGGAGNNLSAAEQKINRLVETGLDRNLAIGITDGRFRISRNPDTQRAEVIDVATGQAVGQTVEEQTVETVRNVEPSAVFDETNVSGALGASGFGASALNAITDAVGMGQAAPEIGRAQQELNNLSTRSMLALSAEFPGRPSNLTRERIEAMTVKPAELTTGPEAALNKAAAMRRMVQQAYDAASRAAAGEGGLSSAQRTQARASLAQLEPLLADYIALENALRPASSGAGIRPDVADRLDAYQ